MRDRYEARDDRGSQERKVEHSRLGVEGGGKGEKRERGAEGRGERKGRGVSKVRRREEESAVDRIGR